MKRNLAINSKIISLCTLVMMLVFYSCNSSAEPTNRGEEQIREYKVEEFESFFTENKTPTVEQMIKAFGQPKISTLYIGDSVAKQQGDVKPTLDRSAWIYEIGEGLEFVSIQVDQGRVIDVYITNRKSKNRTYIRLGLALNPFAHKGVLAATMSRSFKMRFNSGELQPMRSLEVVYDRHTTKSITVHFFDKSITIPSEELKGITDIHFDSIELRYLNFEGRRYCSIQAPYGPDIGSGRPAFAFFRITFEEGKYKEYKIWKP